MVPVLSVFARSPDGGRGLARDFRVRWALAELGRSYDIRRLDFADLVAPAHLARQPFGQIPTLEEDDLILFESGAIILHLATCHPGLLPSADPARARAIAWMFAAVGTLEPVIVEREAAGHAEADRDWHALRLPIMTDRIDRRLGQLARALGPSDWLEGAFTAGDLMMIDVLRRMGDDALLARHPTLAAYVARGEARAAFREAFAAQRALFLSATAPPPAR